MSMVLNSKGRGAKRADLHVLLSAHATTELAVATAAFRRVPCGLTRPVLAQLWTLTTGPSRWEDSSARQCFPAAFARKCSTSTCPGPQAVPGIERSGANGSAAHCQATARLASIDPVASG